MADNMQIELSPPNMQSSMDNISYKAGSGMPQETLKGDNIYLRQLLNPFKYHDSHLPDLDPSPCVLKVTTNTNTISQPSFTTSGMVLNYPTPNSDQLRLYWYSPTNSRFYLNSILPSSEDLSQNYTRGRLINSGLEVYSSTVTGTTFAISGNLNAITYSALPELPSLSFDSLVTYAAKSWMAAAQLPIFNGVVAINPPPNDSHFQNLGLNSWTQQLFGYERSWDYGGTQGGVWNSGTLAGWTWSTDTETTYPVNWSGRMRFRAYLIPTAILGNTNFTMTIRAPTISSTGVVTTTFYNNTNVIATAVANQQVALEWNLNIPPEVEAITFNTGVTWAQVGLLRVSVFLPDYGLTYQWGPGSIVAWEGVTPGQQITVTSVNNWEAVPNASLSRQVGSSLGAEVNVQDLEAAMVVFDRLPEFTISTIMQRDQYQDLDFRALCKQISARGVHYAYAAGMIPSLVSFLLPYFSPMLKDLAEKGGSWAKDKVRGLAEKLLSKAERRARASYVGSGDLMSSGLRRLTTGDV
jgi:hypothetical protein